MQKPIFIALCSLCLTIGLTSSCKNVGKETTKAIVKKEAKSAIAHNVQKQALKQSLKQSLKSAPKVFLDKGLSKASLKQIGQLSSTEQKALIKEIKVNPSVSKIINDNPQAYIHGVLRNTLKTEMPKGRAALKVIPSSPGSTKYYPKLNNLGTHSKSYMQTFNQQLLLERRKAVQVSDQLPTVDMIKKTPTAQLELSKGKDAGILRNNMQTVMGADARNLENAFGGAEAHHIIPGEASIPEAQKARALLNKFGININHPSNGVFLPEDKNSIYKGFIHKGGHTPEYYKAIWNAVKGCKTKDEMLTTLNQIGTKMISGDKTFSLYNNAIVNL